MSLAPTPKNAEGITPLFMYTANRFSSHERYAVRNNPHLMQHAMPESNILCPKWNLLDVSVPEQKRPFRQLEFEIFENIKLKIVSRYHIAGIQR